MKQLGEPVSEVLEAEHGELSKPQTVAALEEADFATFAPSEKTGVWHARELSAPCIKGERSTSQITHLIRPNRHNGRCTQKRHGSGLHCCGLHCRGLHAQQTLGVS